MVPFVLEEDLAPRASNADMEARRARVRVVRHEMERPKGYPPRAAGNHSSAARVQEVMAKPSSTKNRSSRLLDEQRAYSTRHNEQRKIDEKNEQDAISEFDIHTAIDNARISVSAAAEIYEALLRVPHSERGPLLAKIQSVIARAKP